MILEKEKEKEKIHIIPQKSKFTFTNTMGVLLVIVIISTILSFYSVDFLTEVNLGVIARSFSITALVGMSQMVIIAGGGMNVSVGAIGGLSAIVSGALMEKMGYPMVVAILAGLLVGLLCGMINGYLISKMGGTGVASFLITLATTSVFTGITLGISNAHPYYNLSETFINIGTGSIMKIPTLLIIMLIIAIIIDFIFRFTGLGKQILAMGGNMRAAEFSGILVKKVVVINNIISGLLAASAGILLSTRLASAQPDIGTDWMLFSFAAPLIGGTRLAGGYVNTFGAVLGAVILALISNGLVHINLDVYWMQLIEGIIIFAAVSVDRIRTVKEEKRERMERDSI